MKFEIRSVIFLGACLAILATMSNCKARTDDSGSDSSEKAYGASIPWTSDGCFDTAQLGAQGWLACISGSSEEGIGGSGTQVALFNATNGNIFFCEQTTGIKVEGNKHTFQFGPTNAIVFTVTKGANKLTRSGSEGEIQVGKQAPKKFVGTGLDTYTRMLEKMNTLPACKKNRVLE